MVIDKGCQIHLTEGWFDASGYIQAGKFSVSLWAKLHSFPTEENLLPLFNQVESGGATTGKLVFYKGSMTSGLLVLTYIYGENPPISWTIDGLVSEDEFHCYSIWLDGEGNAQLYLDGVDQGSQETTASTPGGNESIVFGAGEFSGGTPSTFCQLTIDAIVLHPTLLSALELQIANNLYNSGDGRYLYSGKDVAYGVYNFDEGSGPSVENQASLGNFGTLNGTYLWEEGEKAWKVLGDSQQIGGFPGQLATVNSITKNPASYSIEFWMKLQVLPVSGDFATVVVLLDGVSNMGVAIINVDGTYYITSASDYPAMTNRWEYTLVTDADYHIVLKGDGDNETLFVNNEQVGLPKAYIPAGASSNNFLAVLGLLMLGGYYYYGTIDELRAYSVPISNEKIAYQHNGGLGRYGTAEEGLICGYHFDEVVIKNGKLTVVDYSGNDWDLQVGGLTYTLPGEKANPSAVDTSSTGSQIRTLLTREGLSAQAGSSANLVEQIRVASGQPATQSSLAKMLRGLIG